MKEENVIMKSAIGVDIGGTNIKVVQVVADGSVLTSVIESTPAEPGVTSEEIKNTVMKILKDVVKDDVVGIGFGIAGIIDRKNGTVIKSPNIPSIDGLHAKEIFEQEFSLPVVVDNDANTYAYGEKWVGAGKNYSNFAVLTLGTGLGGGIIYKSELFEGHVEIGHITIEPRGRFCTCGSLGCLESYASGRAIIDRTISSLEGGTKSMLTECCDGNFYKVTPELIYKNALEGDNLSREVFRETGQYLGMGIANLVNIFSLEAVILGGGLIGAWDLFIEELKQEFMKRTLKPLTTNVEILKSTLKEDGGSIGAAGLILKITGQSGSPEIRSAQSSY
jgi:glucokinase